eukprot:6210855-Pleurochrysis_carterae.AAC.1
MPARACRITLSVTEKRAHHSSRDFGERAGRTASIRSSLVGVTRRHLAGCGFSPQSARAD